MENILTLYISWDPNPAINSLSLPFLGRPILWYGLFFALGFFLGYLVFQQLLKEFLKLYKIRKKAIMKLAEKVSFYVIIGAIIGARLGEVLFYQSPSLYAKDPIGIFRFWEGGLSSHGGVIGILIALWVLRNNIKKKYPMLTWVAMLDLLCIPALLAGGFIRIGNFFNQEIVGIATGVPWAVLFAHPADGLAAVPRHAVQLYEALFYFSFFVILWILRKKIPKMFQIGKTSGLFFIGTFAFRFLIEFIKVKQSALVPSSAVVDMGQWLSLPLIVLGVFLFFQDQNRLRSRPVKRHQR